MIAVFFIGARLAAGVPLKRAMLATPDIHFCRGRAFELSLALELSLSLPPKASIFNLYTSRPNDRAAS